MFMKFYTIYKTHGMIYNDFVLFRSSVAIVCAVSEIKKSDAGTASYAFQISWELTE